jgi:two-component system, OmpR family, alkaline phosphatase synthesis response regulator PhoP
MTPQKRILVADDDRFMREMLRIILSRARYDVTFAEDGRAAVDKAADEKPDLVLSDGLLPKLHGFEACKAIKKLEHPPKVVLLTGTYTKPTYKHQVIEQYGADAVLNKPFKADDLLSCIETQLAAA